MRLWDSLRGLVGKYVTIEFVVPENGVHGAIEGTLEEVNDDHIVIKKPNGNRVFLTHILIFMIEVEGARA